MGYSFWITCAVILLVYINLPIWYLHRDLAHGHVKFSTAMVVITRIILWTLTHTHQSRFNARLWAAVHIKHHVYVDTKEDSHSPYYHSMGWFITHSREYLTLDEIEKLTKNNIPKTTWIDKYLDKYPVGPEALLIALLLIFSWKGIVFWCIAQLSKPFSNLFNYAAHIMPGYNNTPRRKTDRSRNLFPIGLVFCGEELHGNHHSWPSRSNLGIRWFELDTGYWVLKFLSIFKLVTIIKSNDSVSPLKTELVKSGKGEV